MFILRRHDALTGQFSGTLSLCCAPYEGSNIEFILLIRARVGVLKKILLFSMLLGFLSVTISPIFSSTAVIRGQDQLHDRKFGFPLPIVE